MSFIELIDGTGKSYRAKVNDRNQLLTRSVSQTRESFSTEDGNANKNTDAGGHSDVYSHTGNG